MKNTRNPSSIRLQDDVKIWLLQQAFREDRTLSNMVNKLLKECKERWDNSGIKKYNL